MVSPQYDHEFHTSRIPHRGAGNYIGRMRILPELLSSERQHLLLAKVRAVLAEAPLYSPVMPRSGSP